ncbi:hypothetical protein [Haladaptatus salinisoli]|nr:hypothetical protein [Haladaptatus salinisoli]
MRITGAYSPESPVSTESKRVGCGFAPAVAGWSAPKSEVVAGGAGETEVT